MAFFSLYCAEPSVMEGGGAVWDFPNNHWKPFGDFAAAYGNEVETDQSRIKGEKLSHMTSKPFCNIGIQIKKCPTMDWHL